MSATTSLLAELRQADHIIKTMLNAMTVHQQARVGAKLEADGVAGEGMTRHHERAAVIAAAAAPASASAQRLRIEQQAVDILSQADHADILLQALFDKLDPVDDTSPEVAAINCFATCTARAVALMREAADNIVALVVEGGAA
ncbi:hypothetical protein J2X54_000464 [Duganella sp. 3397]|uniref:hypothetical protein n=1 Tax=Duganella sp. 3397 TaxID=2817732 RepID=UPI00286044BC|nr:hypothetical protein [Duganella sp. 3397]MDR7048029.1 hypothetical protein [Duganella sp. 3397]